MTPVSDVALPLRPGVSDIACVVLLLVASVIGATLEPIHSAFWHTAPFRVAVPLLLAGILLSLHSKSARNVACVIHGILLVWYILGLLLAVLLFLTILYFGTAIVLFGPCLLLAGNSIFTLTRVRARNLRSST